MEIAAQNAFKIIFPRYSQLMNPSGLKTNQDLEIFVRQELPQKVEMVRKLQVTFVAFLNQYTNLILKRPQMGNLIHGIVSKATERSDKIFKQFDLEVNKLDKNSLQSYFTQMDMPRLRQQFRQKLGTLKELIDQKYINNPNLGRQNEEQIAIKLFTLLQTYHFTKSDLATIGSKYRMDESLLLEAINNKTKLPDIWTLFSLDANFVTYINQIVSKRCRPSINKRDFFANKIKQIFREKDSSVGQNFNILIDAIVSKQGYRVGKQIFSRLYQVLKTLDSKDLKSDEEEQCKQIIEEVDTIKKQFNSIKNNSYYIDLMRGTFIDKYKMELGKLQNLYYLSNMEKYLQDVSQFLSKLVSLQEKVIDNRKRFVSKLGADIQGKIDELLQSYQLKNDERTSIENILNSQFQALQNSLYGVIDEPKKTKISSSKDQNQQKRKQRMYEAEEKRQKFQQQRAAKDKVRQQQLQKRKAEEQRRKQDERIRLQQRKIEERQKYEIQKRQRQQKQRIRKQQLQFKEQQRKIKQNQDRKNKQIQMQRRDEQRQIKQQQDRESRQQKSNEIRQRKLLQDRSKQDQRNKKEEQRKKDQQRLQQQKRIKEQEIRQQQLRKKQQEESKRKQKQQDNLLRRQKQQQDKIKKDREAQEKKQKIKEEQDNKRRVKQEQDRKRGQKQQEDRKRREKQQEDRKKREKQQEDRKKREKQQEDRKKRERETEDIKRKQREQEDRKRKQKQLEDKKRKEKELEDKKLRDKEQEDRKKRQKQEEDRKKKQKQLEDKNRKQVEQKRKKQEQADKEKQRKRKQQQAEKQKKRKLDEIEKKKKQDQAEKQRKKKQLQDQAEKQIKKKRQQEADKQQKRKDQQQKQKQKKRIKEQQDEKQRKRVQQINRKQQEQKKKKQKQKQEAQKKLAANKKVISGKGSGINYGEFDDLVEDDLQEMEAAGQNKNLNNNKKPDDDQYVLDYDDDFDDYSPDKQKQHDEDEEEEGIEAKQLIDYDNFKCVNDYLKGTQYARKNKPNLEGFNNFNQYLYVFEEFIQNGKMFFFDTSNAKAILDYSVELTDEAASKEDLQITEQTIQQNIIMNYSKNSGSEQLDPQTSYVFPFSFPNKLNILIVQVVLIFSESPPASKITVVFKQPLNSDDEETVGEFQMLIQSFMRVLCMDLDPIIQDYTINQESKMVIETFDKQLPNLLTLFAMHYEHNFEMKLKIDQYTTERFFYISNILDPLYKAIENEDDKLEEFYGELAEKYSYQGKEDTQTITIQIEANHQSFKQELAVNCMKIKDQFLSGQIKTLLVLIVVMVPTPPDEDEPQEEEPGAEKITVYFQLSKQTPKPILNYFIIAKNQEHHNFVSEDLVQCIFSESDSQFQTTVYTDYTRHNALQEYCDWSIALWPHIMKKKKMSGINAFRVMALSMVPYYVAYKKMD